MSQVSQSNVKILVVDDESDVELLIKQKFRRQMRENIYDFIFALNSLTLSGAVASRSAL